MLRPRWNFSSRAQGLSGGDALILSIPKSGRTWVRTFLSAYFSHKAGRHFSLQITDVHSNDIPRIIYSHDRFEHRTKGGTWDRIRGKYIVPGSQTRRGPIVLLARDPRDAFTSYFVQLTRRNPATPDAITRLSADALLRHSRFGIAGMIEVMNAWLREFGHRSDSKIVRYEDLRAHPEQEFAALLLALVQNRINQAAFHHALHFSDFENMQRLEASGAFDTKILQPRDRADRETFKVRRGKIGEFRHYLSLEGQKYAARACTRLDSRFGYLQ